MLWTRYRITAQPAMLAAAVPLTLAFALVAGGCGGGDGGEAGDRLANSTATGGDVPRADATGACQAFSRASVDLKVPPAGQEWPGADRVLGGYNLAVAAQRRDARYGRLADAATQAYEQVARLREAGIVAAVRSALTECTSLKLSTAPGSGAAPTADAKAGCAALARARDQVHATQPERPGRETTARVVGAAQLLKAAGTADSGYRGLASAGQHVIDDVARSAPRRLPTDTDAGLSACAEEDLPH